MSHSIVVRRVASIAALLGTIAHAPARAGDPIDASLRASRASIAAAGFAGSVLVTGSIGALTLAGTAVVTGVEAVGDGSVVVLRGVGGAANASIRLAGGVSLAVGTVVEVVAVGTGCALMQAGRMIAFIPNEVGRSLVHQRQLAELR